jgi:hypothetical protein
VKKYGWTKLNTSSFPLAVSTDTFALHPLSPSVSDGTQEAKVTELVKGFNTFKKTNKIDYLTVYTKTPHFHNELKKLL